MERELDREHELNASVVSIIASSDRVSILRIRPDTRSVPDFVPGQFVQLGLPVASGGGFEKRAYSVASSPDDKEAFEFLIARVDAGRLSPELHDLEVGARCWLDARPLGRFTLADIPRDKDLVLVATGTGIAPYVSMLRTYRPDSPPDRRARWHRLVVIHGARRPDDLAYRDELVARAVEDPTVCYLPVVSREPERDAWMGLRGRVQSVLEGDRCRVLAGVALEPERTHLFLCGNPDMIREVRDMLVPRGFVAASPRRGGNLHTERYW